MFRFLGFFFPFSILLSSNSGSYRQNKACFSEQTTLKHWIFWPHQNKRNTIPHTLFQAEKPEKPQLIAMIQQCLQLLLVYFPALA